MNRSSVTAMDYELARFVNGSDYPIPSYWQQFEYYFTSAYAAPEYEGSVKSWMNLHFQVCSMLAVVVGCADVWQCALPPA